MTGYPFDEIRGYFSLRTDIPLVLVYGSFARGKADNHSDVDIAVKGIETISLDDALTINAELTGVLKREVDLVDLSLAEGIFLHRIMSEGKRMKETIPQGRVLYEKYRKKALYFNADLYPIYSRDQNIRLKRMFFGEPHGS